MKILCLPCLENRQLQKLAEETIRICQPITGIQPALFKVKSSLDLFKNEIIPEYDYGENISRLEKVRNRLITGLMQDVKAEAYFPHSESEVQVINRVLDIVNEYGISISRLSPLEVTEVIDSIVFQLKNLNQKVLKDTGLYRWLPLLEEVNKEYKVSEVEMIDEHDDVLHVVNASAVVSKLVDSLENLYLFLYVYAKISESKSLNMAYSRIEEMVNAYK